jgi:hypothetical protein
MRLSCRAATHLLQNVTADDPQMTTDTRWSTNAGTTVQVRSCLLQTTAAGGQGGFVEMTGSLKTSPDGSGSHRENVTPKQRPWTQRRDAVSVEVSAVTFASTETLTSETMLRKLPRVDDRMCLPAHNGRAAVTLRR